MCCPNALQIEVNRPSNFVRADGQLPDVIDCKVPSFFAQSRLKVSNRNPTFRIDHIPEGRIMTKKVAYVLADLF